MKLLGLALMVALSTVASAAPVQRGERVAFVDVNVVPMARDEVLAHQTVLVDGDMITAIGPSAQTSLPAGARRIEGHGSAFLMPGLADMHTHVSYEEDLALFTANGVTTALHMGEAPSWMVVSANQGIDDGSLVGPRVYFAFLVDGTDESEHFFVSSADEARAAVDLATTNGYSFIKVYNHLTAPEFEAIVAEAQKRGVAVIGHGVRAVGLPQALYQGEVMVAHAEEFYYTAFHNEGERSRIPDVVAATLKSGAYVTPNLSGFESFTVQWGKPKVGESFLRDPRAQFMTPDVRLFWAAHNSYLTRTGSIEPMLQFLKEFTKALSDAGVPLLTGTDSPLPGLYPGYSIHDDLRLLIDAGLTPYQALSAATRVPGEFIAKYLPKAPRFGTVASGRRADLVLLRDNPLIHLATAKKPLGVMTGGRWRTADELKRVLEEHRALYNSLMR